MVRVQEIGNEIVQDLRNLRLPSIHSINLDDWGSYTGGIVIHLDMERNVGKYWFKNHQRPLRTISAKVRGILKRYENQGKISGFYVDSPEATYDPYGGYDGYENDYIMISYTI